MYSGKLLVSFLIAVCAGRIFFSKRESGLCYVSAVALVLSVAETVINGTDCVSLALCAVSLFTFITNIHAMSRMAGGLVIDYYNPLFVVFSLVSLCFAVFLGGLTVYFADSTVTPKMLRDLNVSVQNVRYKGSFVEGFDVCPSLEKADALIRIYENKALSSAPDAPMVGYTADGGYWPTIVVLATDKRAGAAGYDAYMAFLAAEGYTVITGEFAEGRWAAPPFGTLPMRRLSLVLMWLFDRKQFQKQHEFYTFAIVKEYKALLDIARKRWGARAVCLVSDEMSSMAAKTAADMAADEAVTAGDTEADKANAEDTAAETSQGANPILVYHLEDVLAVPGLGFVQQADPMLAWHLGLKRDRTLAFPKQTAERTAIMLRQRDKAI